MTVNLIETLKTSMYSPKHTNNTETRFQFFKKVKLFKKHISPLPPKTFHADLYGIVYIVQGHTA